MTRLETLLQTPPYSGYLYAYPHKTAYRAFEPPLDFAKVWQDEPLDSLFLYLHIPFCEMRCGFCNLFTMTGARQDKVSEFLKSLRRESQTVKDFLPDAKFTQIAIGGGTPTILSPQQLEELFDIIGTVAGAKAPISVETSPALTTADRIQCLERRGVTRISLGVESFVQDHLRAMGRPARALDANTALSNIRMHSNADLNIDLIYGAEGQKVSDFVSDIQQALIWLPEEIFIYPLYVGPLTGLSKRNARGTLVDELRLEQYRAGREMLLAAGYVQSSMRRFIKQSEGKADATAYTCQEDGMIGLGAGARSYTRNYHYSHDYAVGRHAISQIIDDYIACDDFSVVHHGIKLRREEKSRRYVIKSILNSDGLDLSRYHAYFGRQAIDDIPDLLVLIEAGYLTRTPSHLKPTSLGFEWADAMGPFLTSVPVKEAMRDYQWA